MIVVRQLSQRLVLLKNLLLFLLSMGVVSCSLKTTVEDLTKASDKPTITVSDLSLTEGSGGNLVFTISQVWPENIVIPYSMSDASAETPSDYTSASGNVTIVAGLTSATLAIATVDDSVYEGAEQFLVDLSAPANAVFSGAALSASKPVEVLDNEIQPTVQYASSTSSAGEATTPHLVTVTLSAPVQSAVTVAYAVTGGTATGSGADFTLTNGTLTFAGGETTKDISIAVVNDAIYEDDETITMNLSSPAVAALGVQTTHTHTIIDDESPPTVQYAAATSSAAENTTPHGIVVTLSAAASSAVTVNYSVTGGTATGSGTDYTLADATLTFAAGETTKTISFPVVNDAIYEAGGETIALNISSPTVATLGSQTTHTHTITDDDSVPIITFNQGAMSSDEDDGVVNIQIDLSNPSDAALTVDYVVTAGTATASGTDYTLSGTTVTIAAGQTTANLSLTIVDDVISELTETAEITLSNPSGATVGVPGIHTHSIIDNEVLPKINFAAASASTGEATATQNITVTLSGTSSQAVTADYAVTGGNATGSGTDYTLASGTLTFAAGMTSQDITITIVNDVLAEGNETVEVTLSNPNSYAALGTTTLHTHTILDDESAPTVQYAVSTSNANENVGSHTIQVTLSAVDSVAVTVDYAVTGGSATAGGTDYTLANNTLTFASGETVKNIVIPVVDDSLGEDDETIEITLSNVAGGVSTLGALDEHTFTINASDAPTVQYSATTSSEDEDVSGGAHYIAVALSNVADADVVVDFSVTGGTASGSGTDYSLLTASPLTITAGQTVATIALSLNDDAIYEDDETILFDISNPSASATLGSNTTHAATIVDDETAPTVQYAAATSSAAENSTPHTIVVTLSGVASSAVTVDYAVAGGTATGSGTDYTLADATLTFAAGETTKTISFAVVNDTIYEYNGETINLDISNPTVATLGSQTTHTHTITDDDTAPELSIADNAETVTESVGTHNVVVDLTNASSADIVVNITLGGTATGGGTDYTRATTFTIPSGSTSYSLPVVIVDDSDGESNETIILTMASVTGGATAATIHSTDNTQTMTITDNDAALFTWLGTTGDGLWSTASNWAGGAVPSASDTAIFTSVCASNCAVSIDSSISVKGFDIQSSYTGTITQASTHTVTVGSDGWTQAGGTFAGGTGAITMNGAVAVTAGVFTSTSGTMSIADSYRMQASTFNHNSGTVVFQPVANEDLRPGTDDYNHVTFQYSSGIALNLQTETLEVKGDLLFDTTGGDINNGTINAYADIDLNQNGISGDISTAATIAVVGGTGVTQTLTSLGASGSLSKLVINSLSDVVFAGTISISQDFTHTASNSFDPSTSTVRATGSSITQTFDLNGIHLYNLRQYMNGTGALDFTGDTVYVDNDLTLEGRAATVETNNGTIEVAGNLSATTFGSIGTAAIVMTGSSKTIAQTAGSLPATLRVNSSGTITLASNVSLSVSGADFDMVAGTLNQSSHNLTIDDNLSTAAGTVIYKSCGTLTYSTHSTALGTIYDGSDVSISIADAATVGEGDPMAFVVTLTPANCMATTFDYATSTGTATSGSDFTASSGTATITAGVTTHTLSVSTTDDAIQEPSEYLTMTLSSLMSGVYSADVVATGSITDNDLMPTVDFASASQTVDEDLAGGTVTIVVTLSGASSYDITVPFSLSGSATGSGTDYTAPSSPLTIPAGDTTKTVTFSVVDDSDFESDETVIYTILTPTNASLGATTVHTVTIEDDDSPIVNFSTASQSVDEIPGLSGTAWTSGYSAWTKRLRMTIDNTGSAEAFTDFTVRVSLQGLVDNADVQSAGQDLRFLTPNGTLLNHEIETWNTTTKEVWVKLPSIAASDYTHFYVYYGNSGASDGQNITASWNSNYLAVWHLDESATTSLDSTSNSINITKTSVSQVSSGAISAGAGFVSTSSSHANAGTTSTLLPTGGDLVVSLWVNPTTTDLGYILNRGSSTSKGYSIFVSAGNYRFRFRNSSSSTASVYSGQITLNEWAHVVGVYSDTDNTNKIYVNGQLIATESNTYSLSATAQSFYLGRYSSSYFDGSIDEVRIRNAAVTDHWVKMEYLSQSNSLLNYGPVETQSDGAISVIATATTASGSNIVIPITVTGTATAGTDYTSFVSNITITAGQTTATVTSNIYRDTASDDDETAILTMGTPSGASLGTTTVHTITINDVTNNAPVATGDSIQLQPDSVLNTVSVLSNDTDSDSDLIMITGVTQGTYGTVTYSPVKVFYTPNPAFSGADSFTYTISDGRGGTDTGTVNVTVRSGFNWTGGTSTAWNVAGNWYGGAVPGAADVAYFSDAYCSVNCSATISGVTSIEGIALSANYTGTVTQNANLTLSGYGLNIAGGTFTKTTSTITLDGPIIQSGGTFNGGSGNITLSGRHILVTGGTFNSTSGTLANTADTDDRSTTMTLAGGSFNHNSGTVTIDLTGGIQHYCNMNGVTFYKLTISGTIDCKFNSSTITVNNDLTLSGANGIYIEDLTINAKGHINTSGTNLGINYWVIMNGTTPQTVTSTVTTGNNSFIALEIASSSTVTLSGFIGVQRNLKYTSGTLSTSGSTIEMYSSNSMYIEVAAMGSNMFDNLILNSGSGYNAYITGTVKVAGTLTMRGSGRLDDGIIEAYGTIEPEKNVVSAGSAYTTIIKAKGNPTQTIAFPTATGQSLTNHLHIDNGTGGTLSFTGDAISSGGFTYVSGTVTWPASIEFKYQYYSQSSDFSTMPGTMKFNDVVFNISGYTFSLTGNMNIAGNVTFNATTNSSGRFREGNINLEGNFISNGTGTAAASTGVTYTTWTLMGPGTQTLTAGLVSGEGVPAGTLVVNKSTGTVELASAWYMKGGSSDIHMQSGTLNMNGYLLNISYGGGSDSVLTLESGTVINRGGGTLTYEAIVNNGGTIN